MPTLKLEIDEGSLIRLAELAVDERRPLNLMAEVLLLQALGRWPVPRSTEPEDRHPRALSNEHP
jgi:hypothetical protein